MQDLEEILEGQEGLLNLRDEEISKLQRQLRETREQMKRLEEQAARDAEQNLAQISPTDNVDQNLGCN